LCKRRPSEEKGPNHGRSTITSCSNENVQATNDTPNSPSHRVEVSERSRFLEITAKTRNVTRDKKAHTDHIHECTSEISSTVFELPRHVQRLTASIPEFVTPRVYKEGDLMDIIVATDSSVVFGVGYHGWIIGTRDEQILLCGGGPYDGPADLMSSYRSVLGGTAAGLAALGTLFRSDRINIRSVRFLCNNEPAVLAAK
jgi:hypothetical protein